MRGERGWLHGRGGFALLVAWSLAAAMSLSISTPSGARADDRSEYLIRLLQSSSAFRVRTQAALSLGTMEGDPQVVVALSAALRDDNAAVRAAAASSLGRVGDGSVVAALRALERDREAAVRTAATSAIEAIEVRARAGGASRGARAAAGSGATEGASAPAGPARFYIGIGHPNVTGSAGASASADVRSAVERRLGAIGQIVVAPDGESVAAARRELQRRSLTGVYLDISLAVEDLPGGAIRARCSVVVQDYPGRNVRSMLSGSATVTGASAADSALVEAAVNSALNRLPTALAAASSR